MAITPKLTVVSLETFSDKAWKRLSNYAFAAEEAVIPIVMMELIRAVPAMPLAFLQSGDAFELVAVTAMQPGTNWFVAPDGRWLGGYIPAALRVYPFRLIKLQDRSENVLCIDEASGLIVEAGQGESFFDEKGEPNNIIKELLDVLSKMERSRLETRIAVNALAAAKLLRPWPINIKQEDKTVSMTGLYTMDETALKVLDNDAFLPLRRSGALPVAYAQLFSMNQLSVLQRLLQQRNAQKASASAPPPPPLTVQSLKGIKGIGLSQDDGILKFS